jgi:protoporphyrinogen oxidase
MDRRRFLLVSAASATLAGCSKLSFLERPPAINYPGMRDGHWLRDGHPFPSPSGEIVTDVAILGSGVAALAAAWKLSREGFHRFIVVSGPEFGGNAAGGRFGELAFPRGAHYIPLPSIESVHVREMLADLGLLTGDPMAARPYFDETALVHAPEARVYHDGKWQEGVLPTQGVSAQDLAEQNRFFKYVESLKQTRGADGKRVFCIPIELSSTDPKWRALDTATFKQWLEQQQYASPVLHWYLDYVCRDDYGASYDVVSAWAGLHYFASRAGHARNAEDGAVLTWPDGLNTMITRMSEAIDRRRRGTEAWRRTGFVARAQERAAGVEIVCLERDGSAVRSFVIRAKRAICAMPLLVAARVVPQLADHGFDTRAHMPSYAPWVVSNFLMRRFPQEQSGAALSWDNIIYRGRGLGYVVSTHQEIRVARPAQTVFSAYQALSGRNPDEVRKWLANASANELYEEAAADLSQVYGFRFPLHVRALDITVRGHAMASPLRGFLDNAGIRALRAADGHILFAHSDLSGYSVFEEAAWWGYRAARKVLGSA